jgi:hypothetical protein
MDSPRAELDEEEHIQGFQPQRFHRKEITGQELVLVLAKESPPGAALPSTHGCSRDMLAFEHVSYGGASYTIAELEQFSFDFARAPPRVLSRQAHDQRFKFHCDTRSTHSRLVVKGPFTSHQIVVPPQHGFRREQEEA